MTKKITPKNNNLNENLFSKDKEKSTEEEGNIQKEEENNSQIEESLEFFGKKIKEARIANNLSLESVSGHLHISVKILEAIEEGKPEKGPTPVFFRGLVRTYCKFLELDKIDFIDKFDKKLKYHVEDEKINIKTIQPVFSVKESLPIRNILTFLVILIGGILIFFLHNSQTKFNNTIDNITKSKSEDKQLITNKVTDENSQKKINYEKIEREKIPESIIEKKDPTSIEKLPKIASQKNILNTNIEPLTLEVEASEGTWVSVAIDNLATRDYRIDKDEIQQWVAKKNFILTIGNTKTVRVLLNGREIETDRTHDLLSNWLVDSNLLP